MSAAQWGESRMHRCNVGWALKSPQIAVEPGHEVRNLHMYLGSQGTSGETDALTIANAQPPMLGVTPA